MAAMNTLIAFYQNIGPALTVLVIVTFLRPPRSKE